MSCRTSVKRTSTSSNRRSISVNWRPRNSTSCWYSAKVMIPIYPRSRPCSAVGHAFAILIEPGQRLSRLLLAGEVRRGADRGGERRARILLLTGLQICQAKVILNLGVVGKLGGALLEKGQRPLVDAALVEDPSQGVRDARILRGLLLGDLGKL